jgi:Raf kinase inhibitor-like YbhB/YbcL family protein
MIPSRYTCDGENVSPPLSILDVPEDAESLVLIMEDPDSPGRTWVHWRVWNISPQTSGFREGEIPLGAVAGVTAFGTAGYGGPCPAHGEHRYVFKLYALRTVLRLPPEASDFQLQNAMTGNIIEHTELVGYYRRKPRREE